MCVYARLLSLDCHSSATTRSSCLEKIKLKRVESLLMSKFPVLCGLFWKEGVLLDEISGCYKDSLCVILAPPIFRDLESCFTCEDRCHLSASKALSAATISWQLLSWHLTIYTLLAWVANNPPRRSDCLTASYSYSPQCFPARLRWTGVCWFNLSGIQ